MTDLMRLTLPDWLVLMVGAGVVIDLIGTSILVLWWTRRH